MTLNRAAEAYVKYEKIDRRVWSRLDSPLLLRDLIVEGKGTDGGGVKRGKVQRIVVYMACVIFRITPI